MFNNKKINIKTAIRGGWFTAPIIWGGKLFGLKEDDIGVGKASNDDDATID